MSVEYIWLASLASFISMVSIPTRTHPVDNFFVSAILGLALGWLLWPLFVYAGIKIWWDAND